LGLPSIGTLRDGPSGLLRVRKVVKTIDLILRSALQERVSKDGEPLRLAFFSNLLEPRRGVDKRITAGTLLTKG
jgi:hypothetical protein